MVITESSAFAAGQGRVPCGNGKTKSAFPLALRTRMIQPILIAIVTMSLTFCIGCSNEHRSKQNALQQQASTRQYQRFLAQRAAIDLLVQEQMKEHAFLGSKQEFASKNWRTIFDSLVGEKIDA